MVCVYYTVCDCHRFEHYIALSRDLRAAQHALAPDAVQQYFAAQVKRRPLGVEREEINKMKKRNYLIILIILAYSTVFGQSKQPLINNAEKKTVIDSICTNLGREYIFPEITKRYIGKLKNNLQSGQYDLIKEPEAFAAKITEDLADTHKDEHLIIRYNPEWIKNEKGRAKLDEEAILRKKREDRNRNYGFEEIKILPGNIGYFKFNGFSYDIDAFNVAVGAMNFLANTEALIIDLRQNGGGSPEMVQFLCSYFLDNPRKHLNSFYYKEKDKTTQYWTYTYLPGKRVDKVDLYILTSRNTFSAAEEFSYNLQKMKRATVIGEVTGGGAHDNKFVILNDHFMMSLPFARAENPITKTNWEKVGVEPDIKISSNKALETAQVLAMKKLSAKEEDPKSKKYYLWLYEGYNSQLNPVMISMDVLKSYVGTYGPRTITLENSSLFYQREKRTKMKMIPITEDHFMFNETNDFRIKFLKEDNKVFGVEGYTAEGPTDRHLKEK